MPVSRRSKVYKDAVKKMTASADALRDGTWQGNATAPQNIIDRIPIKPPAKPRR